VRVVLAGAALALFLLPGCGGEPVAEPVATSVPGVRPVTAKEADAIRRRYLVAALDQARKDESAAAEDVAAGRLLAAISRLEGSMAIYRRIRAAYPDSARLIWLEGRIEKVWKQVKVLREHQSEADHLWFLDLPKQDRLDAPEL